MIQIAKFIPSSELFSLCPDSRDRWSSSAAASDCSWGDNDYTLVRIDRIVDGLLEDFSDVQVEDIRIGQYLKVIDSPYVRGMTKLIKRVEQYKAVCPDILVDLEH